MRRPTPGPAVRRPAARTSGAAAAVAALLGCAPLPPPTPPAPPRAPAVSEAPPTPSRAVAAIDSGPSPAALTVLETIPEPLAPQERVAPPAAAGGTGPGAPPASRRRQEPGEDRDESPVPVPAPTPVLGERSAPPSLPPPPADGPAAVPGAKPPATPDPSASRPPPAGRDTCWRVQVGAPAERDRADRVREAAQSLLLAPVVVEPEKGLFKVRTRDCLDADAAARLKDRAVASGFTDAFRFSGPRP